LRLVFALIGSARECDGIAGAQGSVMIRKLFRSKPNPIGVDVGRSSMKLAQVAREDGEVKLVASATINVPEARLLTVQPYDQASIKSIEKAIMESDIGLTPNNDGQIIRLQVPELTEERRKQLVKVVRGIAEEGRVAIRNIRRDVMHDLRELKDSGDAGADDEHRAEVELQKLTDARIAELETALKAKEAEILEV